MAGTYVSTGRKIPTKNSSLKRKVLHIITDREESVKTSTKLPKTRGGGWEN